MNSWTFVLSWRKGDERTEAAEPMDGVDHGAAACHGRLARCGRGDRHEPGTRGSRLLVGARTVPRVPALSVHDRLRTRQEMSPGLPNELTHSVEADRV